MINFILGAHTADVAAARRAPARKLRPKQKVERYASEIGNLYAKDPSDTNKGSAP
ncbi:MAG: hypothetical protein LW869_08025 [Actinobacteria bacterium]|nr:hypothetical protein [Actinomycetota bacterium]